MAANKAEIKRDRREVRLRREQRKRVEFDISLDQRADRRLQELKRETKEIKERLVSIEKLLSKK